jgi:2-C-methyl-D-erythritol 4-phosphate cytidylyltransferase
MRYWLVMPAAGSGQRFRAAQPKQYASLEGRTVIEWALAPFLADPRCARVVVALAAEDRGWAEVAPRCAAVRGAGHSAAPLSVVTGGQQRSLSVRSALAALAPSAAEADWVLVHDAARPCLDAHDLERLLEQVSGHAVGGLLAVPAADTLKRAEDHTDAKGCLEVAQTLDRAGLWRALTPQMFRYGRLCTALDVAHVAGRFPSDEAQALEWLGEHPRLVEGAASNLKVTTADDLWLAAAVLRSRHGGNTQVAP